MEIYANGKNIPTFAFSKLFTRGECYADTITFCLDRYYNGEDMLDFAFVIRGVSEGGAEARQTLTPRVYGRYIALDWQVASWFTVFDGKLELELRASNNKGEAEGVVVKYLMPPVYVNPSAEASGEAVPDSSEQIISEINGAVSDGISEIREVIGSFDLSEVENRLDDMDDNISVFLSRPEVIPITQKDYDNTQHKENSLYVIVKEAE